MPLYEVGKPYNPARPSWPEGAQYNYRSGQHELILFYRSPQKSETMDVRKGDCEFGLLVEGDVIFLLYRFGESLPWSDATFSTHLVPEDERSTPQPELSTEIRALLSVILVDAATGIIKAMRAVTLSPSFTAKLQHEIYEQSVRAWPGPREYARQLQDAYRRYPTSDEMARAALARTKGGA